MISLKKNDKIILIVAVVILVVAGVGVAMYQSPEPPNVDSLLTTEKSYNVTWTLLNSSLSPISEFAGKKAPYEGSVTIPEGNVYSVTFDMSWTDDRMTLLKRRGLDTLTLDVTMPDGIISFSEENTSAPKTGYGTISYTVNKDFSPHTGPIEAENDQAAQAKLQTSPYYDDSWTGKDIKINVSCHVGELRILKKLRDKGNDFELKISYQYFKPTLTLDSMKNTGSNSDSPPDDYWTEAEITQPPYISMIISTGCGRFV
jgi:hypothetical protein